MGELEQALPQEACVVESARGQTSSGEGPRASLVRAGSVQTVGRRHHNMYLDEVQLLGPGLTVDYDANTFHQYLHGGKAHGGRANVDRWFFQLEAGVLQ